MEMKSFSEFYAEEYFFHLKAETPQKLYVPFKSWKLFQVLQTDSSPP